MPSTKNLEKKSFYITSTLPYVNAKPHIGFAMELIRADIIARYKKLIGFEIFFNTGTDEHGQKIFQKAREAGKEVKEYVDEYAEKFRSLKELLNLTTDLNFVRTTDEFHIKAAEEFWRIARENGFIYKKKYKGLYCVSDELFLTEKELVGGRCPAHPNEEPTSVEEENYFFKLSDFQNKLLELYKSNPDFVIPETRFGEIKKFVESGLEDFSISRLKEKMPWGIPVPTDPEHVMYVWFDALVNYISVIGWPDDMERFNKWWPVTQYAGKDNLRQQAAMWQAMLMAVGLPPSRRIIINGFITSGGVKMSKSLGNVISPTEIVEEYGAEALRYFVARELHPFEDSDFTKEKFKEAYNANLANGLGNLVSRIMKMAEIHLEKPPAIPEATMPEDFKGALDRFNIQEAANIVWKQIGELDKKIQETEPFKMVKTDPEKAKEIISGLVVRLYTIGRMLNPLMPETSEKIKKAVKENKTPQKPLFLRK